MLVHAMPRFWDEPCWNFAARTMETKDGLLSLASTELQQLIRSVLKGDELTRCYAVCERARVSPVGMR